MASTPISDNLDAMRSVLITALLVVACIAILKWARGDRREATAPGTAVATPAPPAAAAPAELPPPPGPVASADGAWVSGLVSFQDQMPAPDIQVTASVRGGLVGRTRTNASGEYRIGQLPGGLIQIMVSRSDRVQQYSWEGGGGPSWRNLAIAPRQFLTGVDFTLERGTGRIAGVVMVPSGGPAADVRVSGQRESAMASLDPCAPASLPDAVTRTQIDGSFLLTDLPPGNYAVGADDERGLFAVRRHVPASERDARLTLGRGGVIAGAVVGSNGAPAPVYRLTLTAAAGASPAERDAMRFCWRHASGRGSFAPDSYVALTQNDGTGGFELWGMGAGSYDLTFTAPTGERATVAGLKLAEGEQRANLSVALSAEGVGSVRGRAVRADGTPIAGAWVFSFDAGGPGTTRTGADGAFEARGALPATAFTLRIRSDELRAEAQRRTSIPAGASRVEVGDIRLGP